MSTSSPQSTTLLSDAIQTPTVFAASGPYAQPNTVANDRGVDARSAAAARIGPFVPAPWRSGESVGEAKGQATAEWMSADAAAAPTPPVAALAAVSAVELPWIHAFIEPADATATEPDAVEALYGDIDAAPMLEAEVVGEHVADGELAVSALFAPIEDVADVQHELQNAPTDEQSETQHDEQHEHELEEQHEAIEAAADVFIDNTSDAAATVASDTDTDTDTETVADTADADAWPLDDAGALMRALAAELPATAPVLALPRHEAGKPYATPLGVPPIATTPPLPIWGEDDMMDIMPVRRSPDESSEWGTASAAATTSAQTMDESTSELAAAAAQLEALARRVRQGDLPLAGYTSDMSDAATLAATLTALLSARP